VLRFVAQDRVVPLALMLVLSIGVSPLGQ
jgi:hypothetical protein